MSIIPLIMAGLAVYSINFFASSKQEYPARELVLSDYKNVHTFMSGSIDGLVKNYNHIVKPDSFETKIVDNITGALLKAGEDDLPSYRSEYIVAADFVSWFISSPVN